MGTPPTHQRHTLHTPPLLHPHTLGMMGTPSLVRTPSLVWVLVLVVVVCTQLLPAYAFLAEQAPLRIDCGSLNATGISVENGVRLSFVADAEYASGGAIATIPDAASHGLTIVEATLRYFPTDTTSCYRLNVASGRYLVRLGWAYFNYDKRNDTARFQVLLQGTLVETVDISVVQSQIRTGAYYSDYIAFALNGSLSVCFQPTAGASGDIAPPFLNSLEVLPIDTDAYDAAKTGQNVILSTYLRLNMGGLLLGPEPQDPGHRVWAADVAERQGRYKGVYAQEAIEGTQGPPDYVPQGIFQTCREAQAPKNATGFRMTIVPVDKTNSWYLRYYFAELNPNVTKGQRRFNILLGSGTVFNTIGDEPDGFDILAKVASPLTALVVPVFFNFSEYSQSSGQDLEVGVKTLPGSQYQGVLSAVELYEVIPVTGYSLSTTTTDGDSSGGRGGGLSGGAIAGIVVGAVVAALLLTLFTLFLLRKRPGPSFVALETLDEGSHLEMRPSRISL